LAARGHKVAWRVCPPTVGSFEGKFRPDGEAALQAGENLAQHLKLKVNAQSDRGSRECPDVGHRCCSSWQVGTLQPSGGVDGVASAPVPKMEPDSQITRSDAFRSQLLRAASC